MNGINKYIYIYIFYETLFRRVRKFVKSDSAWNIWAVTSKFNKNLTKIKATLHEDQRKFMPISRRILLEMRNFRNL
jgi:hypothetical protein